MVALAAAQVEAHSAGGAASPEEEAKPDPASSGGLADADAAFCAGHCQERGLHGCEVDLARAAEMYEMAAEGGHVAAMWRLGELLEKGRGVPRDEKAAVAWHQRAAETGYAQAQADLAMLLEEGRGCQQDDAKALRWHLAAAEQGHPVSQYCAGRSLTEGRGAAKDPMAALHWLRLSADKGFGPALRLLRSLEKGEASPDESEDDDDVEEAEDEEIDHAADTTDVPEGAGGLASLAQRIARQLQDLGDGEAAAVLEELLDEGLLDCVGAELGADGAELLDSRASAGRHAMANDGESEEDGSWASGSVSSDGEAPRRCRRAG